MLIASQIKPSLPELKLHIGSHCNMLPPSFSLAENLSQQKVQCI
jgi:hypothetical protein